MRPFLRTTLAGDDRGPRALAAFSMLIGVYLVVRAIGLDPVPSLVNRLSGEARGSTVVAAAPLAPREPRTTAPHRASATPSKRGRAERVGVRARTAPTKTAHPRRRSPADRTTEAQLPTGGVAPAAAPTATPARPNPPKSDDPQAPAPVADPGPIVPPAPPAHLPDPPTVPLPDPTAAVDPGTLTPTVALPVEPPLPNLPSLP
jgi:hypothetical protein